MITERNITILDCGYDNISNITLDESEYNSSTHKIFGKIDESYFKIKSDGSSLLKIQTILNGVQINDSVEFELMYKNNDDNCKCYLSLSANNGQSSNKIQYGMKEVILQNSKNRWTKIKGVLPCSSGQLLSKAYHGTAFLLGFEDGTSGQIEIRNLKLKIETANNINYKKEVYKQCSKEIFESKYRRDYEKINKLGNNLTSYNLLNINSGDFAWDSDTSSLRLSKQLNNYQGNVITTQLSYEEPFVNNNKYLIVKLNYKLVSGNPKIFLSTFSNILTQKETIDIPPSNDFITKYFIIPINSLSSKQDIINVYIGYKNQSTFYGELYIKEFTCYNNIFTNMPITNVENDFSTYEQLFSGNKDNGYIKTQDGTFIQWKTVDINLSTLTSSGSVYKGTITINNDVNFSSLHPYMYSPVISDYSDSLITIGLSSFNNVSANIKIVSSTNIGTFKIRLVGFGRWK